MLIHKLKFATIIGSALTMLAVAGGYVSLQIGARAPAAVREAAGFPKPQEDKKFEPGGQGVTPALLTLPVIYNDAIIAVTPKDGRSVNAMVVDYGIWQEYRAPEGVLLHPIMSSDVFAPDSRGPRCVRSPPSAPLR